MADDKQTSPTPKQTSRPESIPVKSLILIDPVDGIGSNGLNGLKSAPPDAPTNRARNVISFVPHMRAHRIDHYAQNAKDVTDTYWVHESRVKSWLQG